MNYDELGKQRLEDMTIDNSRVVIPAWLLHSLTRAAGDVASFRRALGNNVDDANAADYLAQQADTAYQFGIFYIGEIESHTAQPDDTDAPLILAAIDEDGDE